MDYKCLTIAGFDGSGGAGLQADLKTFSAFGCYGMTVLTALPIQNTQGVKACYEIPTQSIQEQLETLFEDIKPDAIKIGMLFSPEVIEVVGSFLSTNCLHIPLVVDPVMYAKSGHALLQPEAMKALITKILPLATLVTPNLPEAHALAGNSENLEYLASQILELGPKAVLLKGGHALGAHVWDLLYTRSDPPLWLKGPRIPSKNTHGTGCTLSAAITACLAQGMDLKSACTLSKKYISLAVKAAQHTNLGKGNGPVHHFYHLWPTLSKI